MWNWNAVSDRIATNGDTAFNWTNVELKRHLLPLYSAINTTFNWTNVELKLLIGGLLDTNENF